MIIAMILNLLFSVNAPIDLPNPGGEEIDKDAQADSLTELNAFVHELSDQKTKIEKRYFVEVKQSLLDEHELTQEDVISVIFRYEIDIDSIDLVNGTKTVLLEFTEDAVNACSALSRNETIGELILIESENGSDVKLKDVASIEILEE